MKHSVKIMFSLWLALLVAAVATFEPMSEADAAECSAGWGKKVTKLAGLASYPAACRSTVCHVATHEASLAVYEPLPPQFILYFHYRANASSGTGLPACPADVNAAVFKRP